MGFSIWVFFWLEPITYTIIFVRLFRAKSSAEECDKVKVKLDSVSKEKGRTDRRVTELNLKLSKAATDLSEERQVIF